MLWGLVTRIARTHTRQISSASKMATKKIAVCQLTSTADKAANMNVVTELISDAAKNKAEMIFFPEACDFICDKKADIVKSAEPIIGGNIVGKYRELAAKHNVWLSMGGVHEFDESNPSKMYNTHIIINNQGKIVQTYRKLHIFDLDLPEKKVRLMESEFSHAGSHVVTPVDTAIGKIGLSICYDLRFPELSTSLRMLGAEILAYPSAFTQVTGEAHWEILLRARAIETQCYVVAAAQCGHHNPKRQSYGHALVVSPWGDVLANCTTESPSYKLADVSLQYLAEVRQKMPVFEHKRRDMYSLYTLSLRKELLPIHKEPVNNPDSSGPEPGPEPASDEKTNVFGHVRVSEKCVFYKTKLTYAFVNLRCVTPGHVLVAPIRPAVRNHDLTEDEAVDFFKTVRIVQKLMERVHSTNSCTVTIQDGPDAGQTVKHLHCHIMPRKKADFIENDLIYLELAKHDHFKCGHPVKPPRSSEEMQAEADMLRREIKLMLQN